MVIEVCERFRFRSWAVLPEVAVWPSAYLRVDAEGARAEPRRAFCGGQTMVIEVCERFRFRSW